MRGDNHVSPTICWSPDGRQLAASNGKDIVVWDWKSSDVTPKEIRQTESSHPFFVPGTQQLVSQAHSTSIVRDKAFQGPTATLEKPKDTRFIGYSVTRDEILFVTDHLNKSGFVWAKSLADDISPRKLAGPFSYIFDVSLSPDETSLAVCQTEDTFVICNYDTGEVLGEYMFHGTSGCLTVAWHPEKPILVIAGREKLLEIWDTDCWQRKLLLTGHSSDITCLAWNPRKHRFASGSMDKTIRIWDSQSWKTAIVLEHDDVIADVKWSPNGEHLASLSVDGVVKIWDASRSYVLPATRMNNQLMTRPKRCWSNEFHVPSAVDVVGTIETTQIFSALDRHVGRTANCGCYDKC